MSVKTVISAALGVVAGASVAAQEVEVFELEEAVIALHVQPFLTDEELTTLRFIGQNPEAFATLIPGGPQFAAIAVAPDEGFIRGGMQVDSFSFVRDLPDLEQARADALEGCNTARAGGAECEIVLEVSPR